MFSGGVPAFITHYKAIISYRNNKIQGNLLRILSSGSVLVRAKRTLSFKWLGSSALPTVEPPSRRATKILDYEQSLFFLSPSSETCATQKWPRAFLASRGFADRLSRARALPLLNLKRKRDCTQSTKIYTFTCSLKLILMILTLYKVKYLSFSFLSCA